MPNTVKDIRTAFIDMYRDKDIQPDGNIEIIGACFLATEPTIFGKPNREYQEAEVRWYDTLSLNLRELKKEYGKVPVIWKEHAANSKGDINSNYGYLVYSALNGTQYEYVLQELKQNPKSRRATMVYTNPSMHTQYREHGKNDFVCTNAVTYYIKGTLIHAVVQMRSNDAVFGYINDLFWQRTVLRRLCKDLGYEPGQIVWQAQSLHVYPRHFHLIDLPDDFRTYDKVPVDYELEEMGAYDIGAYDE